LQVGPPPLPLLGPPPVDEGLMSLDLMGRLGGNDPAARVGALQVAFVKRAFRILTFGVIRP
jgi:hypothetical protein